MNKQRRQALYRLLNHVADDEQFAEDVELLRPLLEPRSKRARSILPRRDQLPMPETIFVADWNGKIA